jgi:hypothetical protein
MSVTVISKELLNLTQAMLSASEAGNWDEVAKLEAQRQTVLRKLEATINATGMETSIDAIENDLREVLSINTRMLALGEQVRSELAGSMNGLRQGHKAVNAYYGMK